MSVFTQGNLMQNFVVKSLTSTASIPAAGADLLATLQDSQVVAIGKPVGASYEQVIQNGSSAGSYDYFRLAQLTKDSSGNSLMNYGPIVRLSNLINVQAATKTYTAPQEQIYVMGYNGSNASSSLDVSQANEFIFTIAYDHDDMMWSEQKLRNAYDYYSTAPTQKGLATSMVTQINYKERLGTVNGTGAMVSAVMLTDGTAAFTASGSATLLGVTNGSDVVNIYSTGTTRTADTGIESVGAVLRIGKTTGGASGRGTTIPVYIVTATSATDTTLVTGQVRINTPFQGTTDAAVSLSADAGIVATSTNWGYKITGNALTFVRDFFKYMKVKFHFDLKGFGASTVTKTQESLKGVGSWQEVAEYESFSFGNEGALNRMKIPIPAVRGYVDTTGATNYNVITIASNDYSFTSNSSLITGNNPMRMQQFLFIPTAGNGNTVRTTLGQQLNNLLGVSL